MTQSLPQTAAVPLPVAPPRDEAALVLRARSDPDAFAELYRRHYGTIVRYVERRVGRPDVAADLVAETFLLALEKLPGYRERGRSFRGWLYRLASTCIGRWARRRATEPFVPDCEPVAPGDPLDEVDARRAERNAARAALLSLPPRYQTTLALHYLEGLTVDEIASALGCRPGTIKARLSRGRQRMRRALEASAKELFS